ncbi:MAG: translation initiation factor IF-5A [Candidatus Woesearchaeota archaeon]
MSIKFASATSLKKGSYIIIDGEPCRVVSVSTSKPGKHGAAKSRVEGVGIVDEKKRSMLVPGGDEVEVPIIEKRNAQVLSYTDKTVSLMDSETFETLELEIPEDMQGQLSEGNTVVYWQVMHYKILKQLKPE